MPATIPFDEIRWTCRREVCDQLAEFLDRSCAGSPRRWKRRERIRRARERATAVLAALATPDHANCLAKVLLDRRDWEMTRLHAAEGLTRLGADIPPEVMDLLVNNFWGLLRRRHPWYEPDWPRMLCRCLVLLPFVEVETQFLKHVSTLSSLNRGHFLVELVEAGASWEWLDWLYKQWLKTDRVAIEVPQEFGPTTDIYLDGRSVPINVRILGLTRHRTESQELIRECRQRSLDELQHTYRYGGDEWFQGNWEALPPELWTDESELLEIIQAQPEMFQDRASRLELPWNALLCYHDPDSLLTDIENEIRAVSRIQANQQGSEPYHETPKLRRALEILARGIDERVEERLRSIYLCPELHHHLKDQLYELMWGRAWRDSDQEARNYVRNWADQPIHLTYKGRALIRLSDDPDPADREFYWWATNHGEKPEFRYRGLLALEAIGEDTPQWHVRLGELAQDRDAITRTAAEGALLQRGNTVLIDRLLETATRSKQAYARAVALQALGEHAAERFVPLFSEIALELDDFRYTGNSNPASLEACYQLANLATPEGATALLQVCFWRSEYTAHVARSQFLPAMVAKLEGNSAPVPAPHRDWRYRLPWEWRCCGRA